MCGESGKGEGSDVEDEDIYANLDLPIRSGTMWLLNEEPRSAKTSPVKTATRVITAILAVVG